MEDNEKENIEEQGASAQGGNEEAETPDTAPVESSAKKKSRLSGTYWYIALDDEVLSRLSFTRALLTIIAFMLQLVVLLLPQDGLEYVTNTIPSYAYVYMWAVFIMIAAAIYAIVMCFTRNKLKKRMPVEHAPKRGFKFFTFPSTELFTILLIIIFGMEISFLCMAYDGYGLLGMFLCLGSLGVQIWSRMIAHNVLKTAELIPAAKE